MQVLIFITLLVVAYFVGSWHERKHLVSLRAREERLLQLQAVTMRSVQGSEQALRVQMVMGSVVVSVDYFKRLLATLRMFFGGRLSAYETVLDRGRREAMLRMKEEAISRGFDVIINVRIESSCLASSRADGKGVAGIEVLAFGTALMLPQESSFARVG